jgi:uncharacterized membrane protein
MRYAIPILIVALVIPAFFTIARGRFAHFGVWQGWLRVLVALPLLLSATGHFVRPALYASAIPPVFPLLRTLVILTGICEAAGAIGLFVENARRSASVCLALLMVAVFPVNIYIAGKTIGGLHMPGIGVRTAMQAIYIALILLAAWGIPVREDAKKL